jgi:predicted nuclease with TOPRIM domain
MADAETEQTIDPITALGAELDALKSRVEDIDGKRAKLAEDNAKLLETNRKLLGEIGRLSSAPETKPPEPSASDITYDSFKKSIGIKE